MHPGTRQWALEVLGIPTTASQDEIEQAYLELQAVWEPHKLAGDDWQKARATKELEKIEQARRLLAQDAGDEEPATSKPIPTVALACMVLAAFILGYVSVRSYKNSHQSAPKVVFNPQATAAPKVQLHIPSVDISSKKVGEPLSSADQDKVQKAIAGLTSGLDALHERDTLESMGEKAIPAVTDALASPDANTRMNAAMVINTIAAGPDTAPNSDKDKARLRPFFDHSKTVAALSKLAADPNTTTRQNVAYGLGNIGDPAGFEALPPLAQDTDSDVRAGAAYSLGKLNDIDAVPILITLLNDPELSVRETVVEALRPYDTPDAKSALNERLPKETDPQIIEQIKAVLEGRPSPTSDEGQP
jgi:hypothetical protein